MSFSGIISLNHNDPILLLMKYVPYNFYITSKYMVLGSLKYHKIKIESETLHILYRGSLPLDIFESFDNFCLLNQNNEYLFLAAGIHYFYGLQLAFEIFHWSLYKKISLFNEPFSVYSV